MDEDTVRRQLKEVRDAIERNEDEHEVLVSLIDGYEGWLRLHGQANLHVPDGQMSLNVNHGKKSNEPKGRISVRQAVKQVLWEARGAPLHAKEIARRVVEKGAITTAKNPPGMMGLTATNLRESGVPVDKVQPNTWAWVGDLADGPMKGGS